MEASFIKWCAPILVATALCLATEPVYAGDPDALASTMFKELELLPADDLVIDRSNCALGKMPEVWARMKSSHLVKGKLPATEVYCLKVLAVTATENHGADLYIRLAMVEQGFTDFTHSAMTKYVAHDEPGRTMAAILQSANAGAVSYTGITGRSHDLPCSLAFDAGFTWATGNDNARVPLAVTQEQAADAERQCFASGVTTVTVAGQSLPASKAGLIVGAWQAAHSAGS